MSCDLKINNTMRELTKKEKIYVLNEMIRYYRNVKGECKGMCTLIDGIIKVDLKIEGFDYINKHVFPEFYKHDSMYKEKYFNHHFFFWFQKGEAEHRLKYCKMLLKVVKDNN